MSFSPPSPFTLLISTFPFKSVYLRNEKGFPFSSEESGAKGFSRRQFHFFPFAKISQNPGSEFV
jgi:hypothetical protein